MYKKVQSSIFFGKSNSMKSEGQKNSDKNLTVENLSKITADQKVRRVDISKQ